MQEILAINLDKKITELSDALAKLASHGSHDLKDLLKIIHQPGWTTPAERLYTAGIIEGIMAQINAVSAMHQALMSGANQVGKPQNF